MLKFSYKQYISNYFVNITFFFKIIQQYRLLPYLAATYAIEIFALHILKEHQEFLMNMLMGTNSDLSSELGAELHAISCACKPVTTWLARDAIQECREVCGGHGYLKSKT